MFVLVCYGCSSGGLMSLYLSSFGDNDIVFDVCMWYVMISLFLWMNLYMLMSDICLVFSVVFLNILWVMLFLGVLLFLRKLVISVNIFLGYVVLCVSRILLLSLMIVVMIGSGLF